MGIFSQSALHNKMTVWLITSLIFLCSIGLFVGFLVYETAERAKWLKAILTAIILSFIIGGALTIDEQGKQTEWNNGICTECGGEYKFKGASKSRTGNETLYYTCENCDHLIRQ